MEGSFGASRMDRHRAVGSAQHPMRVGGSPPVELSETTPIRAGKSAAGRAGVQSSRRKPNVSQVGAASGRSGSESCRFAAGGAGGRDSRLYYMIVKIETPEASVSGVFNLGGLLSPFHPRNAVFPHRRPDPCRTKLDAENP